MLDAIREQFAAEGATPKGRNARQAILTATHRLMTSKGVAGASLEAIANEANLTQAAVRYYFPTREALLTAFFLAATEWFSQQVHRILTDRTLTVSEQLQCCINWHLEYMENVDTASWLDGSAYWIRHRTLRQTRDEFYRSVLGHYSRLIAQIRPGLDANERRGRAYALLTLILGAWITHGRGSALKGTGSTLEQRRLLADTAMAIVSR